MNNKKTKQAQYESMASKMDIPIPEFDTEFLEENIFNNSQEQDSPGNQRSVILTSGADMQPEPILWLWDYWIAQGKFHILAGAPGVGKTTIAMALAATVTIGGRWPDGNRCESGNIIIWSGEDDPADTLLPRLVASGADRSKVFFVQGTKSGDNVIPFDPATDLAILDKAAHDIGGVKLIIIDPVVNAVAGDSHKNTETRRDLQPIVVMAKRLNAAVIGITHLSKGGAGQDPVSRVIGSIAFTALPRVVMVAAKVNDEEGNAKRMLVRGKSNCGPDGDGFEYHLEQSEPFPGISASSASWGKSVTGTARDLLVDRESNSEEIADQSDAVSMLKDELSCAIWTPSKQASKALFDAGFSKKQVRTAREKLNVLCKKSGMDGAWMWKLRVNGDAEDAEDALFSAEDAQLAQHLKLGKLGIFGEKGHLQGEEF